MNLVNIFLYQETFTVTFCLIYDQTRCSGPGFYGMVLEAFRADSSKSTPKLPLKGPSLKLKLISTCYRARLAPLNEALSGAWASCTLWLLILLPLLPGDRARDELTGGANWPCLGLGASEALFPRAPSACSLLGDSLVGVRILSGFGGGGLSRSKEEKQDRKINLLNYGSSSNISITLINITRI